MAQQEPTKSGEVRHTTLTSLFDDIADAIRTKGVGSTNGDLKADNFDTSIGQIVTLVEGTTGDNAAAGDLLSGKKAHTSGGAAITGTMTNQGAKTSTITTQGGTYTIPAGYHNGSGVITASITASTIDNTIISGESVIEATDDYAWKTTVNVPAGYHNAQTLTKTFSSIFPAPSTEGTASSMLAGYQLYDHNGKKITGTMPNNSATGGTITTQGGTYSIPAGYTSGGTVTASINNAVITSGAGSATISDPSYNSTTDKFDQSASGTVAAPTVGTAGYVSSTAGTKNTNTLSGSKSLNKVGTGVDISGTITKKPSISRTAKPSSDAWIDAASGAATTTKPTTAKPYVRVDSASNTGTLTATPKVTSAGYGTTSYYGATAGTATVGASASDATYVPITEGTAGTPTASKGTVSSNQVTVTPSVTNVTGWITGDTKTGTGVVVKASDLVSGNKSLASGTSAQTGIDVTNYATVSISAIAAGTHSGTVSTHSVSNPTVTPSIGGTSTDISSTTKPSGTDGTDYWTLDPGGSVTTNGSSTAKAKATIGTAGYISADSSESAANTITIDSNKVTIAAGTNRYISKASSSSTQPTASATNGTASVTKNPTASASVTATGFTPLASGTSAYYVTASASSASGTVSATGGSASTTAGSVTVGAGYNPSEVSVSVSAKSASGTSASTTEKTASDSKTIYIPASTNSKTAPTASAAAGTASIVNQPSASASTSVTGMVTTSTNTGYSVSATASANSGNSTATGGSASTTAGSVTVSAGYNPSDVTVSVAASSKSGNTATSTAVSDSASDTKYIQKGVLSASVSSNSGGSASMAATGFTASSSATSYYVTLSTSSGSVKAKASVGTEGYVKSETAETSATAVSVSGNGDKLYIPAADPSFTGGTVSGSTSLSGSNVTLSDTNNGISVSSSGTANRTAVTYSGAVAGYVIKSSGDPASAAPGTAATLTGSTKYISGVTVPSSKSFTVSNSGTTTVTSGSATAGDLSVKAYTGTTLDTSAQLVVDDGKWVTNTPTATGTYYGKTEITATSSAVSWTGPTGTWPK